jgi:hypothetical protein
MLSSGLREQYRKYAHYHTKKTLKPTSPFEEQA